MNRAARRAVCCIVAADDGERGRALRGSRAALHIRGELGMKKSRKFSQKITSSRWPRYNPGVETLHCFIREVGMDDAALSRLLLGLNGKEPDAPSPSCFPGSRIRTALLRESWHADEQRHLASCSRCRRTEQLARGQLAHPSLLSLFWHVRGLLDPPDADVATHLQKEGCKRCLRLVALLGIDRILARLAGQVRGNAKAANRLGRALGSSTVATLTSAVPPPGGRVCCEDGKHAVSLSAADPGRLRVEFPPAERPSLVHLLIGNQQTTREHLVVPHAVPGASRGAEVRMNGPTPERLVVALYEVEPGLLGREDMPALQSGYAAACKASPKGAEAWRSWAAQAMQNPELDPTLRPALDALLRPDGGKRA